MIWNLVIGFVCFVVVFVVVLYALYLLNRWFSELECRRASA